MKLLMNCFIALALVATLPILSGCKEKEPPQAVLNISGTPGMTVTCGKQSFSEQPFKLRMAPGTYLFKFSAPGYESQWQSVTLADQEHRELAINLEQALTSVLVETKPSGAELVMDGHVVAATPLVLNVQLGNYSGQLRMPGYGERAIEWQVEDSRPLRVMVDLDANLAKVMFTSVPNQAQLFIDKDAVGTTPYSITLKEGKYVIRLEAPDYLPLEQELVLRRGEELQKNYSLVPRPGGIEIASDPSGAEIFVNGVKKGITPCTIQELPPAVYKVKASKAGYDDQERTIQIAAGFSDKIQFRLEKSTGAIKLNVQPAGVNITLDGVPKGKSEAELEEATSTKPILFDSITPGTHVVTVSHPRAMPESRDYKLVVEKGRVTSRKIEVWIANCEIKFKDTGRIELGALFEESAESIYFGTEPGVRVEIDRAKLEWIRKLSIDDKATSQEAVKK